MPSSCPNCGRPKASRMFACKPCWFSLPKAIRDKIWEAYRRAGVLSDEWQAARQEALAYWGLGAKP